MAWAGGGTAGAPAPAAVAAPAEPAARLRVRRPLLLVTDFDDTLVPGAHTTNAREEHTAALRDALEGARGVPVAVAVNTGRTLRLFERAAAAKAHCLPRLDALIAGVGTRVYFASGRRRADGPAPPDGGGPAAPDGGGGAVAAAHEAAGGDGSGAPSDGAAGPRKAGGRGSHPGGGAWVEDEEWTARMAGGGWSRAAVAAAVDDAIAAFGADRVSWQPAEEQNEHKATFLYCGSLQGRLRGRLEGALGAAGVEATIIEGAAGCRASWRFVDVLPAAAGKGRAMEFVRQRLGGFSREETVAAGDGANDLQMLQQAQLAIAVGNCQPEVAAWAAEARGGSGGSGGNGGGQRVHVAAPGAEAAAGILEGLAALGFLA
ncbi:hypothetical protein Rsub_01980 [Raphidocelis subcapitata]|uniref:Sucrose phosphatase-like domain-containing protein n=1 Tax=Raphidocelis subcapitata TaxID=307507 RepID=A0A2V0NP60_9CHLO|nr:hypothetical protein Rsub_01980 [Raphidocelis subcapitata]|eukprot:GBF89408.1 hypothetical protein Rsub_01980 [Raphidocelis subcapitata]